MKKMIEWAALAALLTALTGCYQEVELKPWQPGNTLPVAGAYNVRDTGGYPAEGGKMVKTGLLYRSGDLNRLFERDESYLYGELGIKTIVDFRSKKHKTDGSNAAPSEQEENPDKYWDGVSREWADTAIDESVIVPDYQAIIENSTLYPNIDRVIAAVETGYRNIVTGTGTTPHARAQYKKFFEILLDPDRGHILYHCSAGKDRTGVVTALLLSALGVDRETVIKDYLLSAEYVKDKYYPVVPYVVSHTIESMAKGKAQAEQTLGAIEAGHMTVEQLKTGIRKGVEDGVIANVKAGFVDRGTPLATANAMTKAQLTGALESQGQPSIDLMVNAAIDQKGGLDQMATEQQAKMRTVAAMSDAEIEGYAKNAGAKIAPLVTVKREYIVAMFDAIDTAYTGESDTVIAYLKDTVNGLGLTDAQIGELKAKYLH